MAEAHPSKGEEKTETRLEALGIPGISLFPDSTTAYARNIWDMQAFDGRLYFGMGNSNNHPPAPNAKGGHIWSYDPKSDLFKVEYETDEEQVARFRIIRNRLVVPGHDPTDPWTYGNWYRLEPNGWKKHRTIPKGIHCYDMIEFNATLFAALGTKPNENFVLRSKDDGITWEACGIRGMRAYTLFTVDSHLHVSLYRGVAAWDGKRFQEPDQTVWFPGNTVRRQVQLVVRPVCFKDTTIYIGAYRATDHQWTPFGLYAATGTEHIRQIHLPGKPWDLLVKDGTLYVLSALETKKAEPAFTICVTGTKDLTTWERLFQFKAPTFARSFEYLDGNFYFGLGCEADKTNPETGRIFRIPYR